MAASYVTLQPLITESSTRNASRCPASLKQESDYHRMLSNVQIASFHIVQLFGSHYIHGVLVIVSYLQPLTTALPLHYIPASVTREANKAEQEALASGVCCADQQ